LTRIEEDFSLVISKRESDRSLEEVCEVILRRKKKYCAGVRNVLLLQGKGAASREGQEIDKKKKTKKKRLQGGRTPKGGDAGFHLKREEREVTA